MQRLQGKKAIVTGAAQGLGAALLERLGRDVLVDVDRDRLLQLRLFHGETVGVGGDHGQLSARGEYLNAGQDRAHVVTGRGTGDEIDRLQQ